MSFDNSRTIFNPFNDYSSVVMPQGRVQLDADWNEFLAEIARRIQAGALDTMGRAVYPITTPDAFYISPSTTAWVVNIGQGRMYIDGLLAENHGPIGSALWDPALAELSGAPQPAPASIGNTPSIPFTSQPMFPAAAVQTNPQIKQDIPNAAGSYLFYLDVWTREVTWLEDPFTANPDYGPGMVDPGVGIDTSGRLQTVWQVRWMPAAMAGGSGPAVTCGTPDAKIAYPSGSDGLLTNGVVPNTSTGDCCLTTGSGYTGLENQFYRVQIHQGGPVGTATFKWSRENSSVATSVTNIVQGANPGGAQATVLTVASLGRDQVLNFSNGDWIELLDDNMELNGQPDPNYPSGAAYTFGKPGILCQIDTVDPTTNAIYLVTPPLNNPPTASANLHTRIVRWDTSPTLTTAETAVPATGTALQLENGLTVSFSTTPGSNGNFLCGDFWTFSARTDGSYDQLTSAPPRGTHHHYTKLSVVAFDAAGNATSTPDCRTPWPSSGENDCGCCTATVGDNQTTFGAYTSIQQAIDNLPAGGGTVCILPGQYYESIVLAGLTEVTLRGSGPQTTLYAPPAPGGAADQSGSTDTIATNSGISAIITITNSQHIQLTGFSIEAPDGMSCILLDQISSLAQVSVDLGASKDRVARKTIAGQVKKAASAAKQQADLAAAGVLAAQEETIAGKYKYIPDYPNWYGNGAKFATPFFLPSGSDVTLTDLVLTASTRPAIVAIQATLLNIVENRILMKDVASLWPAVYVSGAEITIESNWIGLQDNSDAGNFATAQIVTDLAANFAASTSTPVGNGGIQIGGYSTGVSVVDNQIEGGAFNAISLGAILLLNSNNQVQVSGLNGLFLASPVTSAGTTLVLPPTDANGNTLAADGPLQNILIERNRIGNVGLSAVGPVGFFTSTTPEIVSVANLTILGNIVSGSVQAPIAPFPARVTGLGYGAICLPDLQNLILRDNSITDFGPQPGAQVCGIFILNGEQVEISRNQILETRDWATIESAPTPLNGLQAGIAIPMVSPPALDQSATASTWAGASSQGVVKAGSPPVYQPGLPALRLDQNVVRVPLGCALEVAGYGPFSITGNQLSSGGTVPASAVPAPALTVLIFNLGAAVEFDTRTTFTELWGAVSNPAPPTVQLVDAALSKSTNGMVQFANNNCQLETRACGAVGISSVLVFTLDQLNFANNLTWIDGGGATALLNEAKETLTAAMDVLLLGTAVNISGNRFQEGLNSVVFSGITGGIFNITTGNISTNCLFSETNTAPFGVNSNNVCLAAAVASLLKDATLCKDISKKLLNGYGVKIAKASNRSQTNYSYADTEFAMSPAEKINVAVGQIDSTAADRVQQLSLNRQARLSQVSRIAATISTQSGATSKQATAATAEVTATKATIARFEMLKQQVTVQPPAVTATGWALYGVLYNSSNAPVSAYSLYFVDAGNTYQNAFGIAYSGADGSFQMVYAGPSAGHAAPTAQLFVQVCNASGDPIYTSPTAFTPANGVATYQAITLPAGEKPIGKLPTVFRGITLPKLNKSIDPADTPSGAEPNSDESKE